MKISKKLLAILLSVVIILTATVITVFATDSSSDPITVATDLNLADSWETYSYSSGATTIGTSTATAHLSWGVEENVADNIGGKTGTVHITAQYNTLATALSVTPNTDYIFKFSFYSSGDTADFMDFGAVIKNNTVFEPWANDSTNRLAKLGFTDETAKTWNSKSISFNSGDESVVLVAFKLKYTENLYLGDVELVEVKTDSLSQNFDNATTAADAGSVQGGTPTIETVAGGDGADTKVMRFAAKDDATRFTVGTAANWDDGSAAALTSDMFKVAFDIKMDWNATTEAVVWFKLQGASTYSSARIRSNGAVADATDYYVTDLTGGWKHFEYYFTKTASESAQYFQISNISTSGISYDLDNLVISKFHNIATTGNAAALRAASGEVKKGIRVKNTIAVADLTDYDVTEYGTLVTMSDLANGAELTLDSTFNFAKGVSYDKAAGIDKYFALGTEIKTYTGVLININPSSFASDILVRAYAISSNGKVFYGDTLTLSVYDVVDAILSGTDANDIAVANTYVNEAITAEGSDATVVTYAEWKASQTN